MVVGTVVSAGAAAYKGIQGADQQAQANRLKPMNPGYQVNYGVLDNARTLSQQYGNYQLPGYSAVQGNINTNFSNAFNNGARGATSGNDILGLATKMAYGKNEANNQLAVQGAQGKQSILGEYLNGNASAGQQYQNQNEWERQQYDQALREKAALTQAGATNTYGAIDSLSALGAKYAFSKVGDGAATTKNNGGKTGNGTGIAQGFGTSDATFPDGTPRFDANGNPLPSAGHI